MAERKKTQIVQAHYLAVVRALSKQPLVTVGKVGFGFGALQVRGKIFAMVSSKGKFVVRLSKSHAAQLVESHQADFFEPRPGVKMKEWVVVPVGTLSWIPVAKSAYNFVKSKGA